MNDKIKMFWGFFSLVMDISLYNIKCSKFEYRKQPKMAGHYTRNHPTQDGIPPQERSKIGVILPPKIGLKPCISLISILASPIPPI